MSFLTLYFSHACAIESAAAPLGVATSMQHADFSLHLVGSGRAETWRSKFLSRAGSRLVYTDRFTDDTTGFAGWMPYAMRQWEIATDKIAFKRHALAADIVTPPACIRPDAIGGPFLVKHANSSFGEGIRGPFLGYDPGDPEQQLAPGEYYENFIVGNIAKAWCWGAECVALQLDRPTIVRGDGRSTLRELVEASPNARGENDWKLVAALARYCGVHALDAVLPPGKEALAEFRYGSRYDAPERRNTNALHRHRHTPLGAQFARAAAACAATAPADPALDPSLFTLDAVVDAAGCAWFLEMNCNPLVHPDAYESMLATRFGAPHADARQRATPGQPPPVFPEAPADTLPA